MMRALRYRRMVGAERRKARVPGRVGALREAPTPRMTRVLRKARTLRKAYTLPLLHLLIATLPATLGAQTRAATEQVAVEARAHSQSAPSQDLLELDFHFEVASGWHIYAPDPGDVGLPTRIEWRLPEGVRLLRMEWPVPERIRQPPFDVRAYTGRVVVRAAFDLGAGVPEAATLGARIEWGACREVCIPQEAVLSIPTRRRTPP